MILVGGIAGSIWIYTFPNEAFRFLDNVPVKLLLTVLIWIGLIVICMAVYFRWYVPEPRRLLANTWRFMVYISTVSICTSVLAIPSLAKVEVDAKVGSDGDAVGGAVANFEYVAAKSAAVFTTVVGLVLVVAVSWFYVELLKWEHQHGRIRMD